MTVSITGYNKILLKCSNPATRDEAISTASIYPGTNVVLDSDGKVAAGAGVASATLPRVALENSLIGDTKSTALASGTVVSYHIPQRGDILNVRILASESIAIGDLLKANSDGKYIKTASAPAQAIARQAFSSSSDGYIPAEFL